MLSTDYQTISNQTYYPQNQGYPCPHPAPQAMPHMVPMQASPMFHPLPMTGPMPHMYLPQPVQHMNSGFHAMAFNAVPSNGPLPMLMSSHCSLDSLAMTNEFSRRSSADLGIPLCPVGSLGSLEAFQSCGSSSPVGVLHSYSPQPFPVLPPTISLIPATSQQPLPSMTLPPQSQMSSHGVTVTNWDTSPSASDPVLPEFRSMNAQMLGYQGSSIPRSRSPSLSRGRSNSDISLRSREREFICEPSAEPSKRELVNRAFAKLKARFGSNFDENGNRGKNILRLKVKTRTALEQIVPFIEFCQRENLIVSVSCPISTKKGRQQVRGFLAYLQMRNVRDTDRVLELIEEYNNINDRPFNTWHRDPPSTWNKAA